MYNIKILFKDLSAARVLSFIWMVGIMVVYYIMYFPTHRLKAFSIVKWVDIISGVLKSYFTAQYLF